MITKLNNVRGYKVNMPQFGTLAEAQEVLKDDKKVVGIINTQLTAHGWNSAFEGALAEAAVKAGHSYLTEKNDKGNDVITETDSKFLKRVGFKVTQAEAQAIADGIAYPPVTKARGPKVDAFTQVATTKIDDAIKLDKLAKASAVIADKGYENDGTRESVIAAYATYLRDQSADDLD